MGISGNPSMNGCLIAITIHPAYKWLHAKVLHSDAPAWSKQNDAIKDGMAALVVLGAIACALTGASIPAGVLVVTCIACMISQEGRVTWPIFYGSAALALFVLGVGYALDPVHFFHSTGRFQAWRTIFDWWYSSGKILFGHGTGMGSVVFYNAARSDMSFGPFYWAHNDYLQILFDNGVVGLASFLIALFYTLKKAFDRPWLFASLSGYAATMLFNFPLHVPVHAIVGAALVWFAWCTHD